MVRKWDPNPRVHRRLIPDRYHPQRGADIWTLRRALKKRARELRITTRINPRGPAGPGLITVGQRVARLLGVAIAGEDLSERAQTVIRNPGARTTAETARAQKAQAQQPTGRVREPAHQTRRSPNQSSRAGVTPRIIVLHSTEGAYESAVAWLCNPAADASSHIVISDTGQTTRLVEDAAKAWTQARFNPQALSIEQEGFAAQSSWPDAQVRETAKWVAYWARTHNIPIVQSTTRGVCRHSDLGAAGGNHNDPGAHYPFGRVLDLARGYLKTGW